MMEELQVILNLWPMWLGMISVNLLIFLSKIYKKYIKNEHS